MITSHNAAKTDNRRYCHRKPSHPLSTSQSVSASISPPYPHRSFISTKFFHSKLHRNKSLSASLVCDKDPNTKCSGLTAQKKNKKNLPRVQVQVGCVGCQPGQKHINISSEVRSLSKHYGKRGEAYWLWRTVSH